MTNIIFCVTLFLLHTIAQSCYAYYIHTDEENVKSFLCGLEDGSAGRSDDDDSVFVFLANYATELW